MPLITLQKKDNPLRKYIIDERINKNGNCIILITGSPGTGKTMSALSIGAGLCLDFGIDYIVTGMTQLLELADEGTQDPESFRGKVICYEEPQEEQTNKRSSSTEAVSYVQLLSTFRSLGCVLIQTTPYGKQLTKDSLDYVDIWMQTEGIDRVRGLCYLKVLFIETSDLTKKSYKKYLNVRHDSKLYRMTHIAVTMPPKDLVEHYERVKLDFQHKSYQTKLKLIKRKQNERLGLNRHPVTCPHCGHQWYSQKEHPVKCVKCFKALPHTQPT